MAIRHIRPARLILTALLIVITLVVFFHHDRIEEELSNIDLALPLEALGLEHEESPVPVIDEDDSPIFNASLYRKLYSLSTPDRQYFRIDWGDGLRAYNPNIIPHPTQPDAYIVAGLQVKIQEGIFDNSEIACTAKFIDGTLKCIETATPLPIERTEGHCPGDLVFHNLRGGPRDARMFYGPDAAYVMYGTLAERSCLGLFLQDLSVLRDDVFESKGASFQVGTELQRPPPYGIMQKNWFLFWDPDGRMYAHQDIYPSRTFAALSLSGSAGRDLSGSMAYHDSACMARHMPALKADETIHQATNSLSITLCKRADRWCSPNDDNTFLMTIVHHQMFHDWHAQYYGHVVLFKRNAPFELHAISQKGLWINGKKPHSCGMESMLVSGCGIENHDELFYMTSMSWANQNQTYHGYIDDPLLLAIGIEDVRSGGIDVLAGDLLQDLAFCDTPKKVKSQS
ncbi:hypothetical protein EDD36DRAFT_62800 [Exophiala viscosa]|uniref:Uncharacterized protein n=1 Tax=Exophiala viscosa TaxID=2486360 RepID=A0AAN6DRT9_9EURO|nr:hypothetical protein EDD36DRAFT_62800 [Exophiala viscosa]